MASSSASSSPLLEAAARGPPAPLSVVLATARSVARAGPRRAAAAAAVSPGVAITSVTPDAVESPRRNGDANGGDGDGKAASGAPRGEAAWVPFVAGGAGGTVAALVTCPLEVVKTRLQAAHNKRGLTRAAGEAPFGLQTARALQQIHARDGIRGLWRGAGPHVLGVGPARACHFGTYHWTRDRLDAWRRDRALEEHNQRAAAAGAPLASSADELEPLPPSSAVHVFSAAWAGFCVHTVTSPIWLLKTRMQLQSGDRLSYTSTWDCARQVWAKEGVAGFYKGLTASYVGLSETAMQFGMYEAAKREMLAFRRRQAQQQQQRQHQQQGDASLPAAAGADNSGGGGGGGGGGDESGHYLRPYDPLLLASVTKLMASMMTYPHEVVRTRLREQRTSTKYTGFWQCLALIAREEGRPGLYGGMGAHLLRVVPNSAIMFMTYEAVLRLFSAQYGPH